MPHEAHAQREGALLATSNAAFFRGIGRLLLFLAPRRDLHLDVAAHIAHHAPSALVFACPPPPALSDASSPLILYIVLFIDIVRESV